MTKPDLLTTAAAADHLAVAQHTLEIWRSTGRYRIAFVKVGRNVRYRRSDLDAWLASRTVNADAGRA